MGFDECCGPTGHAGFEGSRGPSGPAGRRVVRADGSRGPPGGPSRVRDRHPARAASHRSDRTALGVSVASPGGRPSGRDRQMGRPAVLALRGPTGPAGRRVTCGPTGHAGFDRPRWPTGPAGPSGPAGHRVLRRATGWRTARRHAIRPRTGRRTTRSFGPPGGPGSSRPRARGRKRIAPGAGYSGVSREPVVSGAAGPSLRSRSCSASSDATNQCWVPALDSRTSAANAADDAAGSGRSPTIARRMR